MKAVLALLAILAATPAAAEQGDPLFAASDPIHIAIQAPLSTLVHNRAEGVVIQGTLTDPGGQPLPVALNVRGITRRASDVCQFPPLRVQFTTAPPPSSIFAGQRKLRLVTHCRNAPR